MPFWLAGCDIGGLHNYTDFHCVMSTGSLRSRDDLTCGLKFDGASQFRQCFQQFVNSFQSSESTNFANGTPSCMADIEV